MGISIRYATTILTLFVSSTLSTIADAQFRVVVLSEQFHSEGTAIADIDGDGNKDVVSGPFWYEGPDFQVRHRYMIGQSHSIKGYSQHFFSFAHDLNNDDRPDILVIGTPGEDSRWFENPAHGNDGLWREHIAGRDIGGESPCWRDLTGDAKPELICVRDGQFGFARPDWQESTHQWKFTPIMKPRGLGRFTHGQGVGDVDGDGRLDVLETEGWHQQMPNGQFEFRPQKFAQAGGSQMFAYDFDGDGDNDVLSVQNAHGWGLSWFERRGVGRDFLWVKHEILSDVPRTGELAISQMHAVAMEDIDGDGVKDIITGKRFFAHGGNDPGAYQAPVLYWFRTTRLANGQVNFIPNLIHERVGVGTQCTTGDVNDDGRVDIVIGNKLGTFVLLNQTPASTDDSLKTPVAKVDSKSFVQHKQSGTQDFQRAVRESDPRTASEELTTFTVPEGFEVQLVASEPAINKPLNMAFDGRGRLWVTSTVEYPYPAKIGRPGRDSVKILEDSDGDGYAETVTTFADGLNIPIGLYPYGDGVICHSIPNIWYLRDTDGDGKCDQREVLYGPFDYTRDAHGLCNGFVRGFDGWLYACHGFNNRSEVAGIDGNVVSMDSGNTFRMQMNGQRIEHYTHGQVNPFGLAFDRRGDLFSADCHTKPVTLLIKGGYYPSFGKPHDGLGFVPDVMEHLHGSTAIGGIAIKGREKNWPSDYQDSVFGGNVMTSRINRNSLHYRGASVSAREEADFLVSGDPWFRPVDLQIGPDGALYVADFYNRIIGHYEVDLNHPGRDRHRGRIWRITYQGNRLHNQAETPTDIANQNLLGLSPTQLVAELDTENSSRRMLITDRLADFFKTRAISPCKQGLANESAHVRIHCMWILQRLDVLQDAEIAKAVSDRDELVRTHAQRILGAYKAANNDAARRKLSEWLLTGLKDSEPLVARAAAMATTNHSMAEAVPALLHRWMQTPADDVHLRHCIRLALQSQLQNENTFRKLESKIDPAHVKLIGGICLALKTRFAGDFIVRNIDSLSEEGQERLAEYVRFVAKHTSTESIPQVVEIGRRNFANDRRSQVNLLRSIASGMTAQTIPAVARSWACDLARSLIAFEQSSLPIAWSEMGTVEKADESALTWAVSTRRDSSDGQQASRLWSSFPNGEQRIGVLRSSPFQMDQTFEFYMAGHDGFPNQVIQRKNFVRLRDAKTHRVLKTWSPPRNDIAQRYEWHGKSNDELEVYLELVDGDDDNAYAWLAVGRFSNQRLNPTHLLGDRRIGMELVSELKLHELREPLVKMLRDKKTDRLSRRLAADAIAKLHPSSKRLAFAESLAIANLPNTLEIEAAELLVLDMPTDEYWKEAMGFASTGDQRKIAVTLASDAEGLDLLIRLSTAGTINAAVLREPIINAKLQAVGSNAQKRMVESIISSLAPESNSLDRMIRERTTSFLREGGVVASGKQVFTKHCAICHQVAGVGKQVGPNLDGIGNRGLHRIVEDVLAPNRNIDVAFHATTIVTTDGEAITGFLRQTNEESQLVVVDGTGKERSVPTHNVEEKSTSQVSPMPSNFGELLSDTHCRDLLSYLLSLTN